MGCKNVTFLYIFKPSPWLNPATTTSKPDNLVPPQLDFAPTRDEIDPMYARIPAIAFQNMVGTSQRMRAAITLGCKVAAHPTTTVLIQGETGTGKELFARGIHYSSECSSEPFVAINCAAIPEQLLESELFGHERGAFSGAVSSKLGLFEFAAGGTVFLDEIGEMPLSLQPKLLRVLESKQVRRLGSLRERDVGCRIVAATNRDLNALAAEGSFREDLYYRLSVIRIDLPALRERPADIESLALHFADTICRENHLRPKLITAAAMDAMRNYAWPGNVRELRNAIEGAIIAADGPEIRPEHLAVRARGRSAPLGNTDSRSVIEIPPNGLPLEDAERQVISATLKLAQGNHSAASRMLRISRTTLMRKIQRYGLHEAS
jgi:two-component system, NtrC family, response regulator AtoC